jgi:phosphatidylglycerophosphatase A
MKINKVPRQVWTDPLLFIACGFGFGTMPWMPGTFGTLVGVVFCYLLSRLSLLWYVIASALLFIVGVWLSHRASARLGQRDHPAIVFDEIVGFVLTMTAIPKTAPYLLAGFVLFRLFDIWKPWPIRWVEKQGADGFAVMADDVVAAFYAWIVLFIGYRLWGPF